MLEDAVTTRARDGEILDGEGSSGVGRGNQSEGVQLIIPGTMVMRNGDYVSGISVELLTGSLIHGGPFS